MQKMEAARTIGLSPAWATKVFAVAKLPVQYQGDVGTHPGAKIGLDTAYEISRMPEDEQAAALEAIYSTEGSVSNSDVRAVARKVAKKGKAGAGKDEVVGGKPRKPKEERQFWEKTAERYGEESPIGQLAASVLLWRKGKYADAWMLKKIKELVGS